MGEVWNLTSTRIRKPARNLVRNFVRKFARNSVRDSARGSVWNWVRIYSVAVLLAAAVAGGAVALKAQSSAESLGISVEASPQIFATMCALDAAGFDADENTLAEMPARLALRADLLNMHGDATDALRQFYKDHALSDPADTLSRYITFAVIAGPPPGFQLPDTEQLPPDVLAIEGFQKVLADFYREAHLDIRWAKIEPEYEPAVERYQSALARIVTVTNAYLREIAKPSNGRMFTVYVEPLVGARTNFRNSGDHYSIVVGTNAEARLDAVQHSYLHFMLDSLVLRYRPLVDRKRALLNVAGGAPRLPVEYHDDFVSFTDECLIKAVELRLRHLAKDRLEGALQDADQSGFILVRSFVTQLQKFEKAEPSMTYYLPDMIAAIDVDAEQKRLQGVKFAPVAPAPAEPVSTKPGESENAPPSELERWIAEGNRAIASRDASLAVATFETALAKYPDDRRAMYGLAIASVLSGNGDRAKDLFERIVSAGKAGALGAGEQADPSLVAWSHVYLGRIHDLEDDRDQAVNEYRAALAVDGAPEAARVAAQGGVQNAYKSAERPAENGQPTR
jgi:Tetratricopeptide repeat